MEKEVIKFSQKLRENRLKKKLSQSNVTMLLVFIGHISASWSVELEICLY